MIHEYVRSPGIVSPPFSFLCYIVIVGLRYYEGIYAADCHMQGIGESQNFSLFCDASKMKFSNPTHDVNSRQKLQSIRHVVPIACLGLATIAWLLGDLILARLPLSPNSHYENGDAINTGIYGVFPKVDDPFQFIP